MNQYNQKRTPPTPNSGGSTRPNTRPNPVPQPRQPAPTYRARPGQPGQPAQPNQHGRPAPGGRPLGNATERATSLVRERARRRRLRTILLGLGVVLCVALGGVWIWASSTVKTIIDEGLSISETPVPMRPGGENGELVPVKFPDWGKKEPVNILLLGLDFRPEYEDTRADTQIIVHIDPVAKSVAMLAIPRDLWLPIPGYGEARINTAYQLGENHEVDVPGGGPSLAMATIEQNFGIPIHYYAEVNFTGFERIVDAMGGVTLDVPRPLVDNEYPLNSFGVTRIYIPGGLQHMDGRTALQYARSRHADSDLGRNARQQQVLLALREQGLNLNILTRLTDIANRVSDAVKTDLSFVQVGSLAQLARDIDASAIQSVRLEPPCVYGQILASGADVLLPNWDCIRPKIVQAFADPKLAGEAARLSVQNGTLTDGVARKVRDKLVPLGFLVPDLSAANDQGSHPVTTITDFSEGGKPHTIEVLARELGVDPSSVQRGDPEQAPVAPSDGKPVDILVMVGDDKIAVTSDE